MEMGCPNRITKNGTDYLLSNQKYLFRDVDVANRVTAVSDNIMVGGEMLINVLAQILEEKKNKYETAYNRKLEKTQVRKEQILMKKTIE